MITLQEVSDYIHEYYNKTGTVLKNIFVTRREYDRLALSLLKDKEFDSRDEYDYEYQRYLEGKTAVPTALGSVNLVTIEGT